MSDTKTTAQIESRAEFLRRKIAKAQNELHALGPVHEVAKHQPGGTATTPNLIAIPCHTGQAEFKCTISLMRLQENFKARGIRHEFQFIAGLRLITFVRNYFANRVAFDADKDGVEFTHLLFIDCDNSGFEDYVVRCSRPTSPSWLFLIASKG